MQSLIFFGSDQYAVTVITELLASPQNSKTYTISCVVTDRPKPKGKDQIIEPNPVENIANKHNLKVLYYPSNNTEMDNFVASLPPTSSLGLCASFDHLLPAPIITYFAGELYNLHPSLLPQYRNVSPVQYAIALGEQKTGITLFRISEGIDNGEIIAQHEETILPSDTTPTLTTRLFSLGSHLFTSYLSDHAGSHPVQPSSPLVFTKRLIRDSGFVEWDNLYQLLQNIPIFSSQTNNELLTLRLNKSLSSDTPSIILTDLIRAFSPWPSVWSTVKTKNGELRVTISLQEIVNNKYKLQILISGKPKPISLSDFTKYYL